MIHLFGSCFSSFPTFGSCFAEEIFFASCFAPCENWFGLCEMPLMCQEGVSHGAKILTTLIRTVRNFRTLIRTVRNFLSARRSFLAMTITFLFQLRFGHCLKRWTSDFPSFKTVYSMYKMDSRKCSKYVQKWQLNQWPEFSLLFLFFHYYYFFDSTPNYFAVPPTMIIQKLMLN